MGLGRDFTTALLIGRRSDAGFLLPRDERERLAASAHARAERPVFTNPLYVALALGYRVRPVCEIRPAPTTLESGCLYYDWSPEPKDVGLRVYHCLAAELLKEAHVAPSDGAVCLLAAELALPRRVGRWLQPRAATALQPHVPAWWVAARLEGLRSSGVVEISTA